MSRQESESAMPWVVLVIPSDVLWLLVIQTGLLCLFLVGFLLRHLWALYARAQRYKALQSALQAIFVLEHSDPDPPLKKEASWCDDDEELPPWDES